MRDLGKESGGGPHADSLYAGQDRPSWVCMHQAFSFAGYFVALLAQAFAHLDADEDIDGVM